MDVGPNTAYLVTLLLIGFVALPIQWWYIGVPDGWDPDDPSNGELPLVWMFVIVADVVLLIYIWMWIGWETTASDPTLPLGFVGI